MTQGRSELSWEKTLRKNMFENSIAILLIILLTITCFHKLLYYTSLQNVPTHNILYKVAVLIQKKLSSHGRGGTSLLQLISQWVSFEDFPDSLEPCVVVSLCMTPAIERLTELQLIRHNIIIVCIMQLRRKLLCRKWRNVSVNNICFPFFRNVVFFCIIIGVCWWLLWCI